MSFVHLAYLPWILGLIALFVLLNLIYEFRYFSWIKRYWFLKRSWWSRLSSLFYVFGISLLLLSLLDLRGPEVRIKANIPDQKTLILIDASMSMLAEDVRPSRFQRSLLMARHFVSKAVGHQISVSIFSDQQKNIIPFTDDVDLLDSRISALEEADLTNAGSNIKQAIAEAVQMMREEVGSAENATGNILIFSDGEEHENFQGLDVPTGINVAFVGVGTLQGSPLPIRRGSGQYSYFDSFKQHHGERVISKLDEDFIRRLGSKIKNYQYWVASSYSMPTDEIINFFRTIFKAKSSQGEIKVRPVMYEYIVIPGVAFLILGFILSIPRTFAVVLLSLIIASANSSFAKEKEEKLSAETQNYLERLKKGELSKDEKLKLGEYLLRDGKPQAALELYEENKVKDSQDNDAIYNYGVSLLQSGKLAKGAEVLDKLQNKIKKDPSKKNQVLNKNIDESLMLAFKNEKQKQDKKQEQKQNEQNQNKDEQKGEDKSKQSKDQKGQNQQGQKDQKDQMDQKEGSKKDDQKKNPQDSQNQSQQGKGMSKEDFDKMGNKNKKDDNKDDKDKQKNDEQKKEEQNKDAAEKDENQKEQNKPKSLEEKEEQIKKQRMMQKLSGNLKELMNVDRQLQQKFLDTRIKDRVQDRDHKDW